jgi:hypothetical protein
MPTEPAPPRRKAPGWHPDPAGVGHGLQRYFDGSSWTGEYRFSTEEPPKKEVSGKAALALAAISVLVLLVIVGRSLNFADRPDGQSGPSMTPTAAGASPTIQTPAAPKKPDGVTFATTPGANGDVVDAHFAIRDNYTEKLIKDGARLDTIEILRYARVTYPDAAAVNVQGTFPMTDPYGNTSTQVAIDLTYLRATLYKINFDGVTKASIWEIRDSGTVLQAFQP